jgi:hypothetical protein
LPHETLEGCHVILASWQGLSLVDELDAPQLAALEPSARIVLSMCDFHHEHRTQQQ